MPADGKYIAVALNADIAAVRELAGGQAICVDGACIVWRHDREAGFDGRLKDRDVLRCLDRYDLVLPRDGAQREQVLAAFFEFLHGDYEAVIEPRRNRENIRKLLAMVVGARPESSQPVLDFGCGSGLSAAVADEVMVELIGFDICHGMRGLAEARGLPTLDEKALRERAEGSLRGAFASYVLHLHPRPKLLPSVWRCIEPGGVFATNLHKTIGLDEFFAYAATFGMDARLIDESEEDEVHGRYVLCTKKGPSSVVRG